jgi:3-hydroxyisobutyrate dehydrogenase
MKLAFIGLGTMGYPMAGHLKRAGHDMIVYNRTVTKARRWAEEHEGKTGATPAAAAAEAQIVFACVGNDDDLRAITLGENGAFGAMGRDTVFVDHTTASADAARALHASARDAGLRFLDAPVSGGQTGAEHGTLTIMVGGDPETLERVRPVMARYARAITLMGGPGAGQLTKMCNQICVAGLIQALAEGLNFAQQAGLDPKQVVEVLAQGAAGSWQMAHRGHPMIEDRFDFGFAVDWMRKDLGLVLDEARRNGARTPITALVDQFYAQIQEQGGGRWDTSSLIRLLRSPVK